MTAPTIVLYGDVTKAKAVAWIRSAERGTVVTFTKGDKRTLEQNAKLHVLCTDVAKQVEWAGKKRGVEAWKDIFTAALRSANHELDVVPGINGGFVLLGMHTSSMTVRECSELIELILAFGAERELVWSNEAPESSHTPVSDSRPTDTGGMDGPPHASPRLDGAAI